MEEAEDWRNVSNSFLNLLISCWTVVRKFCKACQNDKSKIEITMKRGFNELGYNELGYNELGFNKLGYNGISCNKHLLIMK